MRITLWFVSLWLLMLSGAIAAEPVEAVKPDFRLSSGKLDRLVAEELGNSALFVDISDAQFLRRVTLDLIGRQPLPTELNAFLADEDPRKRSKAVEHLLADEEFGRNWANYWSDTISYRVPPPELTFLNYNPLKAWLAERLNRNVPWDEIVSGMLSGTGKVKEQPEATFVAYHQGEPTKLASETARIFLSLSIACAECHDHPFDVWQREQFHQLAAFFARSSVKMPWNEGAETEVKDRKKGEYRMPDAGDPTKKGKLMLPAFLDAEPVSKGLSDVERRTRLAEFITSADNPWFAKAYVNRIWGRLMGRGFFDPVDDMGLNRIQLLSGTHEALTDHFLATRMDIKDLFRLIVNSRAYQQSLPGKEIQQAASPPKPFATAVVSRLRGDEIFDSLVAAIALPDVTPPQAKATQAVRFPPPPKSTRDLINEAFGYDPSTSAEEIPRTISQAMLLMNNRQLDSQINADPGSGTVLSKLVSNEQDNRTAVVKLFKLVLARKPTGKELSIALEHIGSVKNRGAAFEDLLWSLINSTEFTSKR